MRRFRLKCTLRFLVVIVAIVAVDLALIRRAENGSPFLNLPALALFPALSLLIVAAGNIVRGLWKHRQASPFSTGYLLLGGLATFGVGLALPTNVASMSLTVTVGDADPMPDPSSEERRFGNLLLMAFLAFPQVVPALIGGGLAARHGLTIVLNGRAAPKS